jgi:hypothetical protein
MASDLRPSWVTVVLVGIVVLTGMVPILGAFAPVFQCPCCESERVTYARNPARLEPIASRSDGEKQYDDLVSTLPIWEITHCYRCGEKGRVTLLNKWFNRDCDVVRIPNR